MADPGNGSGTSTSTTDTSTSTAETPTVTGNVEVNDFIWKGMNQWYYWQEEVEQLADTIDDVQSQYKLPRLY